MKFSRRTLAGAAHFEGLGLHSGVKVNVTIHPSEAGIVFRRGADRWAAKPENVTDTNRCTKLGEVATIEHLMSAFAGLQVTDAEVEVDGPELPALGGCSTGYVNEINRIGLTLLGEHEVPDLFKRVFVQHGNVRIAVGKGEGHWAYSFDMGERWPGVQVFETGDAVRDYAAQIAPARTFALEDELPAIEQLGLGRGLDESSAIILVPDGYRHPPRFVDEPARHKLLDLMGDLYLAGIPVRALNVVAERSGHKTNVEAAHKLLQMAAGAPLP